MNHTDMEKGNETDALAGLRVADFTWVLAGPLIAKYLADRGAEVIRIESATRPDLLRVTAPYKDGIPGHNRAASICLTVSNKLSIALNLRDPRGLDIAKRIASKSDLVIESFSAGAMNRMGLSYEELSKLNPGIIMLSASIQGQTGPHARQPGYGWSLSGLVGIMHLTGWPGREPMGIPNAYPDVISPWFGIIAIMAALDYRARTGKGQYIDLSQIETGSHFISPSLLDYTVNGRNQTRRGNRSSRAAPHGAYRCQGDDRWCTIVVSTDKEWEAFCHVIGNPDWTKDEKFATFLGRKANEDGLDRLIEEWTTKHAAEEVMAAMQAAGVAAGVVQNCQDIMDRDPQIRHRQYFQVLEHPELGASKYGTWSDRLSRTPIRLHMPAACIGQHNEYVCTKILGMSDDEYVKLLEDGVLEC